MISVVRLASNKSLAAALCSGLAIAGCAGSRGDGDLPDPDNCRDVVDPRLYSKLVLGEAICEACTENQASARRGLSRMPDGATYAWLSDTRYAFQTTFFDQSGRAVAVRTCGDVAVDVPDECLTAEDTGSVRYCSWSGRDLRGVEPICLDRMECQRDGPVWSFPDDCGLGGFLAAGLPTDCTVPDTGTADTDGPSRRGKQWPEDGSLSDTPVRTSPAP